MKKIRQKLSEIPVEYRSVPFWSWNDKLTPDELLRQIGWMKENGIGGFFMHARGGLKTTYLSEEWMQCIDVCCEEAKKLGMEAWAYDENGWPSGFAGGKLLENMENRDRFIISEAGAFDKNATVSYLLDGEELVRVTDGNADGEYLNLYIQYSASTADILNPKVVDQFIAATHEEYKKHMGDDFAKKLKGFFTDEPQYYRWHTPYTPVLQEYFREQYNEDIMEKLGLLFVEKKGYREFRYRFWLSMQQLMLKNFAKKIYDWCDENRIRLTGHYIEETTMGFQNACCAGVMPFYEYMHMPGIDWLGKYTSVELAPRQLGSVAAQLGKEHAMTETFACCGWDATPAELRRVAGFQYVNGVNKMCQHLLPYSEYGERKRDHPVHFTPMNPWVKEHFKEFNDYFNKLGYLLSNGKESVKVAMLHPQRSTYFDYKREEGEQGGDAIYKLDATFRSDCRLLSSRGIAYHFLDETLLEKHGFTKENQIVCGQCTYDYLVIPKILTMGQRTERLIREFVKNGGKVLLLHEAPEYLEGQPYKYEYLTSNCTLEEIGKCQPFVVEKPEAALYYTYRTIEETSFLFVQNDSDKETYTQTFRFADGSRSFIKLDLVTLQTEHVPLDVTLYPNDALLLFPSKEEAPEKMELHEVELKFRDAQVDFDENYLTINVVRYSEDGIHYSEPIYRSVLFQELLERRYDGKLWLKYDFEIQTMPETLTIMAEKETAKCCSINGRPFEFTRVYEDDHSFCTADIHSLVRLGQNSYETVLDWRQSEATYYALFGENVTETLKNCIVYEGEIEAVYLSGKFGVYSHAGFEPYDKDTVCSYDFYIGEVPNKVTELVTDGFPFFKGKLTLKQNVMLEDKNTLLYLPGNYLATKVKINGKDMDFDLFGKRVDISSEAVQGENQIEAEFTISNRNFFGPFHTTADCEMIWPAIFDMCDLPKSEEGDLRYRFKLFYGTKVSYDDYLSPIWEGDIVYDESVMPLANEDGSVDPILLAYDIDEIVSVKSADLRVTYEAGTDYFVENGKLVIPSESSIPIMAYEEYYLSGERENNCFPRTNGGYICFSEGTFFHDRQIVVTYKHSDTWRGSVPKKQGDSLTNITKKLSKKEPVNIVFYGDSITVGANASSFTGASPYLETYPKLIVKKLKETYGYHDISYVNTAKGGQLTEWGVAHVQELAADKAPDLLVLAFGMNDINTQPAIYQAQIEQIIDTVRDTNVDCDIVLVGTMLPHKEAAWNYVNQEKFITNLNCIADNYDNIVVADMTTMHKDLLVRKSYRDMTGNNVNHPNDFLGRVYAQVVLEALSKEVIA